MFQRTLRANTLDFVHWNPNTGMIRPGAGIRSPTANKRVKYQGRSKYKKLSVLGVSLILSILTNLNQNSAPISGKFQQFPKNLSKKKIDRIID